MLDFIAGVLRFKGALFVVTWIGGWIIGQVRDSRGAGANAIRISILSSALGVVAFMFLNAHPEYQHASAGDIPIFELLSLSLLAGPLYWLPAVSWYRRRQVKDYEALGLGGTKAAEPVVVQQPTTPAGTPR